MYHRFILLKKKVSQNFISSEKCEKFLMKSRDRKEYNHTSIASIAKSLIHRELSRITSQIQCEIHRRRILFHVYLHQATFPITEKQCGDTSWRLSHVHIACIFSCDVQSSSCKRFQWTTCSF